MGNRTTFYYDHRRNLTCVLDPDNGQTYYTYDKLNRMTSVKNPWGETAYYEYSPGGKLLARTLGNGCVTYYAYDRRGVTKVENLKSDLSVISTFEYQRDRTGNPLSILREDGSCVYYEYDLNQQLTAETQTDDTGAVVYAWEWDYDRAGNRLWQTFNGEATYYTYNAGNELVVETTDGATTYYDYDRNGNQTAKDGPDGTTYFHYDFENLLRQIDLPDGAHNYFTYDADSKRVSAADSSGYTRFVYQGPDMLKLMQEKDATGGTTAQYTMGQGLESMRRGAASSFYHYDALGSTQELTDGTETVTDTYRYNAWGEILAQTGVTVNVHRYVGRERYYSVFDAPLTLLGLRYYDAALGAFVSRDPLTSSNSYVYVKSAPTTRLDPSGLREDHTPQWLKDWWREHHFQVAEGVCMTLCAAYVAAVPENFEILEDCLEFCDDAATMAELNEKLGDLLKQFGPCSVCAGEFGQYVTYEPGRSVGYRVPPGADNPEVELGLPVFTCLITQDSCGKPHLHTLSGGRWVDCMTPGD